MKYPIYSYRDKSTGFGQPICDVNDSAAIRGFKFAVSGSGIMNFVPSDFDLYKIGTFDTDNGVIVPENVPVLIVSGGSCV